MILVAGALVVRAVLFALRGDYLDWDEAEPAVFPKLKPSTKTISLRLSESMLNEIRLLANKRDIPYQSLIKVFLRERIDSELYKHRVP